MIALQMALLHSIHQVSSYRYLPQRAIPPYASGGSNVLYKYVTPISDVPYHVLIVYSNLFCSGSLVRSKIVVTAASCFTKRRMHKTVVKVGTSSITGPGLVIPVIEIKIHEYYMYMNRMDNDIAMLVLEDHVYFDATVKKVVLVESETVLRTGITIDVSGWGGSNLQPKYANLLLWTEMIVLERTECFRIYKNLLTPSNFCAKYQPERRLSDNGGPAMYNDVLVGIVSFGATNNDDPHVALLTNISYFHRWILLNTKRLLKKYCRTADEGSTYTVSEEKANSDEDE